MWNTRKSLYLTLILTYIASAILIISVFAVPSIVTWYVEYKGREATLPTTFMLTFYPCTPFAAYAVWQMRSIIKRCIKGEIFTERNVTSLRRLSWCSYAIMAIMLISARAYIPFFICADCAGFIGLTVRTFMNLFKASLPSVSESDTAKVNESEGNDEQNG